VGWCDYKAHFTETCEPDRPHLIVHVATTTAAANGVDTVAARHADLAAADLLPKEHLVDAGYVSVDHILDARADHGVELVGPLPPDSGWQACDEDGLTSRGSTSTGTTSGSPAPTARPVATGADHQPPRPAHHPGDLPRARLHALPRSSTLHPLPGPGPSSHLPTPHPVRDPAAVARRADHPGLAGALRHRVGVESAAPRWFPQAATVAKHRLLDVVGEVVPQVPAVSDLDGLWRAGAGAVGVGAGPVAADHLGAGVGAKPGGNVCASRSWSRSMGRWVARSTRTVP
jgi:hypothetical protein